MQKYSQTKNLESIFDLSKSYFEKRMNSELIQGIHYFIPPTNSKTKKAVLWDLKALENWLRGNENNDAETEELLSRR